MIHLTPAATTELKRLQSRQCSKQTHWIRFEVQPGGCAQFTYEIVFEAAIKGTDTVYPCEGLEILVAPEQAQYLQGLTVDYSDDLMGGGFRFHNPNAIATCGCGHSFSTSPND